VDDALGFPADDGLEIGQRMLTLADGCAGLERGLFQFMFPLTGLLPALVRQFLEFRSLGLQIELRQEMGPPALQKTPSQ
jgi:hypothetical protein